MKMRFSNEGFFLLESITPNLFLTIIRVLRVIWIHETKVRKSHVTVPWNNRRNANKSEGTILLQKRISFTFLAILLTFFSKDIAKTFRLYRYIVIIEIFQGSMYTVQFLYFWYCASHVFVILYKSFNCDTVQFILLWS